MSKPLCNYSRTPSELALFPGLPWFQLLITCSIQEGFVHIAAASEEPGKAWEQGYLHTVMLEPYANNLIPRPYQVPAFDCLQYSCSIQKRLLQL